MRLSRRLATLFISTPALLAALLAGIGPAAAQSAPAAAPAIRLGGVVYAQYEYWLSDSLAQTNQFDVTRAYLNVLGSFDHGVSTRVTADIFRPGSAPSLTYRIKYAYFQWLPSPKANVDFRFGATQTPWLDWEESLYGFRMQGSMPMERNGGFLTASDLGVAMDFFTTDKGLLNGSVGIYNGEGYGNAPGGKFLDYEARASLRVLKSDDPSPYGGLRLTGYGHVGRLDAFGGPPRNRFVGEASYRSKLLTLAAQYGYGKNGVAPSSTNLNPPNVNGRVLAAFGVLNVPNSAFQVLARIDHYTPNTAVSDSANTRFIGGVAYRISPNLRLLGDVDAVSYSQTAPLPAAVQAQKSKLLFQTEFTF